MRLTPALNAERGEKPQLQFALVEFALSAVSGEKGLSTLKSIAQVYSTDQLGGRKVRRHALPEEGRHSRSG